MTQLLSINVSCRCVQARHVLVCSRGDGVLQTPTFLSQVKTPMRSSKTTSCLSSSRLVALDPLAISTDALKSHSPPRPPRQRLSSNDPIGTAPTPPPVHPTLLLSGQSR